MKKPIISGLPDVVRKGDAPYKLSATPRGGVFTGEGIKGKIFDPADLAEGMYSITYAGTTKAGESFSITKEVEVLDQDEQVYFLFIGFNNWIETKFYDWLMFIQTQSGYLPTIKIETISDNIIKLVSMQDDKNTIIYTVDNIIVASDEEVQSDPEKISNLYLYDFLYYLCNFEKEIKVWDEINIDVTNDVNYKYSTLIYDDISLVSVNIVEDIINLELSFKDYYLDN
jgi:hypothetical protein